MKHKLAIVLIVLLTACASKKIKLNSAIGHTRTENIMSLDDHSYLITLPANDPSYAYTKKNLVKVGDMSPANERKFLNGLLGPNGEPLSYFRAGSCCSFKTPNGMIGGYGMLDIYRVYWEGSKDTLSIYINMYDRGNLRIPDGLTANKPKFN